MDRQTKGWIFYVRTTAHLPVLNYNKFTSLGLRVFTTLDMYKGNGSGLASPKLNLIHVYIIKTYLHTISCLL